MATIDRRLLTKNYIFFFLILCHATAALSLPFVLLNGLAGSCEDEKVRDMIWALELGSGNSGQCIEIGNGIKDSVFMPLMDQVEIACKKIKEKVELKDGYNLVGISQGNMVCRGIIELCDDAPPVKNYISLGGPHAGQAGPPNCTGNPLCDVLLPVIFYLPIYDACFQYHLAPPNYIKIPTSIEAYLKGCKFLPVINNEISSATNATYKKRFASLHKLVLIMFENDDVLVPKETSWFGYYPNGSIDKVLPANETELYKEDWIGLKALHQAGNVTFLTAPGGHIEPSLPLFLTIFTYLRDDQPQQIVEA